MKYEILDAQGVAVNTIIASSDEYMEQHYPGSWRAVIEPAPTPLDTRFDPVAAGAARLKRQAAKLAKTDPVAALLKLQLEN